MGLTECSRDSKRMVDLMYKFISRHYTKQIEELLIEGKDIDQTIGYFGKIAEDYLQPYKHRNLMVQWQNKFTKKYIMFRKHEIPIHGTSAK